MNIKNYLTEKNGLQEDVQKIIEEYESYTFIDSFMRQSYPKWFYEGTIQGFIYYKLFEKFHKDYLFFLEQPYHPDNMDNRSDIMFVDTKTEEISAIEIKNDFSYDSIRTDLLVLAYYVKNETITYGYGIYFAEDEDTINEWNKSLAKDKELKNYIHKSVHPVGIGWIPL